jgi:hypothetical protein
MNTRGLKPEVLDQIRANLTSGVPGVSFLLLDKHDHDISMVDAISIRKQVGDLHVEYRGRTVEEVLALEAASIARADNVSRLALLKA